MARRIALGFLTFASPAILVSFFVPPPWGEGLFAALAAVFPVALIAVGLGRVGRLGWVLGSLAVTLGASFLGMFLLRGQVIEGPWILGLPAATLLLLGGLFFVPLLLVPLAHGLAFEIDRSSVPAGTAPQLPLPAAGADHRADGH